MMFTSERIENFNPKWKWQFQMSDCACMMQPNDTPKASINFVLHHIQNFDNENQFAIFSKIYIYIFLRILREIDIFIVILIVRHLNSETGTPFQQDGRKIRSLADPEALFRKFRLEKLRNASWNPELNHRNAWPSPVPDRVQSCLRATVHRPIIQPLCSPVGMVSPCKRYFFSLWAARTPSDLLTRSLPDSPRVGGTPRYHLICRRARVGSRKWDIVWKIGEYRSPGPRYETRPSIFRPFLVLHYLRASVYFHPFPYSTAPWTC